MVARRKPGWSGQASPPELPDEPDPAPADLSRPVDLADVRIADVDWSGARSFGLTLEGSRLERVRWTGTTVEDVHLADCELLDCELSGATFRRLRATRVAFHRCRMLGLVTVETVLHDVHVEGCRLDDATLRIQDGRHVVLDECELVGADLQEAVLAEARLSRCNLTGADLTRARLSNVRIEGGQVDALRGIRDLRGTTISQDLVIPLSVGLLLESGITVDPGD